MIIYILIALVVGVAVGIWMRQKPLGEEVGGSKLIIDQAREKAMNMEKIREMLERHEKLSNDDIERNLNISDATVTRYMEELEKMGEARQVGTEGRYIYYTREH